MSPELLLSPSAFQVCEIFDAMKADSNTEPNKLLVDGGMTQSDVLLQLQANLLGVEVHKPSIKEIQPWVQLLQLG